ncbi:MAG: isoamylase early set domain-containing protein [Balneolaceae bacterium]|nr:isoamylase early set domain-containing protein [Balneolaceae bacterium]
MLTKKFTPKRTVCKVTFSVPSEIVNKEVALAGDFNDWDFESLKLKKKKDVYQAEVRLKPENEYKFKYLIDGEVWENDYEADDYVPNEFGTEDSVVVVGK